MASMPKIRAAAETIAAKYKIKKEDAIKILAYYASGDGAGSGILENIIGGDFSQIETGAAAVGVVLGETGKAKKEKPKRETKKELRAELAKNPPERVEGEFVPAEWGGVVPAELAQKITDKFDEFNARYKIEDLSKERQPRFDAACEYVGMSIFRGSKRLWDVNRTNAAGRGAYDVGKVSALADVYLYLCRLYMKAPFIDTFARFAGLTEQWLYKNNGEGVRDLSPAHVDLLQKLQAAQESGLAGLIADGRQNPTGALAILNHWHGWTQSREIIHTDGGRAVGADALPDFGGGDDKSGGISGFLN